VQKEREEQKKQIIDLYLQCYTQEEIASKIGISQQSVSRITQNFKTEFLSKPIVPESLQLYNVWNFQNRGSLKLESYSEEERKAPVHLNRSYGRIPPSLFVRNYWSSNLKELRDRTLKALAEIKS